MHGASFLSFTLKGLEVVQTALAGDFTLELFEAIERHPRSICPKGGWSVDLGKGHREEGEWMYSYVSNISPVWAR